MGAEETLRQEILPQIESFVSDRLQVISYKWLSRTFSVTSNIAKRLLQDFVDKNRGSELQVIFSLAGWLRKDPPIYCVKLASKQKLEEARQEFKDSCSVQIYSVQACIPQDAGALWNAEFVQAEELFNEPFAQVNCLRDNRFCGVSSSFVKRIVDCTHTQAFPSKPAHDVELHGNPKSNGISKDPSVQTRLPTPAVSSNPKREHESIKKESTLIGNSNKFPPGKESANSVISSKAKVQAGNSGVSLTSMWGHAATKSKSLVSVRDAKDSPHVTAVTADAQISINEAVGLMSSDDEDHTTEQHAKCERTSTSDYKRRRKVVFDFSDEDGEEHVISLASPASPEEDTLPEDETVLQDQSILSHTRNTGITLKDSADLCAAGSSLKANSNLTDSAASGISMKVKPSVEDKHENRVAMTAHNCGISLKEKKDGSTTSPKRRKLLKTRIDERGREVNELVWDGEPDAIHMAEKNATTNITALDSAKTLLKPPTAMCNNKSNLPGKGSGVKKQSRAGGKDAKQGNIMLFFKKV